MKKKKRLNGDKKKIFLALVPMAIGILFFLLHRFILYDFIKNPATHNLFHWFAGGPIVFGGLVLIAIYGSRGWKFLGL